MTEAELQAAQRYAAAAMGMVPAAPAAAGSTADTSTSTSATSASSDGFWQGVRNRCSMQLLDGVPKPPDGLLLCSASVADLRRGKHSRPAAGTPPRACH